jgi:hypothetical protein
MERRNEDMGSKISGCQPIAARAPLAYDPVTRTAVLFGGDNGGGDCCDIYYSDTWLWNGVIWKQASPSNSPPGRTEHSLAFDAGLESVIMHGGYFDPGNGLADTWVWNGINWEQLNTAAHPGGSWGSNMDYDPMTGGLVLFGGEITGDPFTNATWLFVQVPVP